MDFWRHTPTRTFVLTPIFAVLLHTVLGNLQFRALYLPIMLWGYLQFRLCGRYRSQRGGGGPGLGRPAERLVVSGPYAWTRNPMYLGHVIFLVGLSLALASWYVATVTVLTAIWFHHRVTTDEKSLTAQFGQSYSDYLHSVKRWFPGLF